MARIIDPDKLVGREEWGAKNREYQVSVIEGTPDLELKQWLKEHRPFTLTTTSYFNAIHKAGGYISDKKGILIACYIGLIGLSIGTILMAGHYSLIILAIVMIMSSMSWTIGHNGSQCRNINSRRDY